MTLEDRYFRVKNDPERRAKVFKIIWIAAYSMLLLGAAMIIWALFQTA